MKRYDINENEKDFDIFQLHRRFIAYFLRLSGMIYSKIGMELFEELAEKILVQLRELLSRTQSPLTSMELVQVVTISFFCVFHALRKTNVTEKNASSQLQESAVRFSISLFGLLLERLNEVMSEETVSVPGPEGQLHLVLPAIRVFSSWLSLCKNEYTDVVCNPFETENFTIDTWGHLAKAANFISRLKLDAPTPLQKPSEVHHILPEDLLMCGFLVEFCKPVYYAVIGNKPAEVSAQFARLVSVVELGDYLDGSKFAFFCVDPTTEQYKSKGHTIERHTKSRNRRNTVPTKFPHIY